MLRISTVARSVPLMRLSLLCPTPPSRGIGGAPVVELLVILAVGVGHFPVFDRNTFKPG